MSDIAVIILTKDEKLHIGRCLERIAALSPRQFFVVDCFSRVYGHHHKMIKQTYFPKMKQSRYETGVRDFADYV